MSPVTGFQVKQSKRDSLMEAVTNTTVGFFVSLLTWAALAPIMGIPLVWSQNFIITAVFTVVSVIRSYILRRAFNGRTVWQVISR